MHHATIAALVATAMLACGGDDGDPMLGDPTILVGRFNVDLVAPVAATGSVGYTALIGVIYDKPQPEAVIWDPVNSDGACTLLTPRVPFCASPCGGSAVCVANDVCEPYATKQVVGTIHVRGLLASSGAATEFDLAPIAGNYQVPGDVRLAYPGFADGAAITLQAAGSDFTGRFTLAGTGIAPLELTSVDPALAREQAVALTWTAAATGATSEIAVQLDISHHGGSNGKIVCRAPDTGALTLSAPLMTQLLDLGAAGFPTIIVGRTATTSAVISAGRVDLVLSSTIERPVTVPGIQSCIESDDCPPGQTCQTDLTCR